MDETTFEGLAQQLKTTLTGVKQMAGEMKTAHQGMEARIVEVEQKAARRGHGGGSGGAPTVRSWGRELIGSEGFKASFAGGARDGLRARVEIKRDPSELEVKSITTATGSGASLIPQDIRTADPVMLPQKRLPVRALLMPGQTASNAVYYPVQTVRTNNAAVVAEGALKPESTISFESVMAPVRTIAHFMTVSRQAMDDAPALASMIDGELRYGLLSVEENEFLFGDGTGEHVLGMVPQATAFDPTKSFAVTSATGLDVLIQAIAQAEGALLPASGMILNTIDWLQLRSIKDGQGRYLSNGPFGGDQPRYLWDLPVAATMNMPRGKFLVGSFDQNVQIFDRLEVEVLVSTEDRDNFVKNLITIRAEERLAMTVKRPQSLIFGSLPGAAS